jgi:hypothetical protein
MSNDQGGVSAMSAELGPKPAAWRFQQATYGVGDVRGRGWLPALKFTKPGWGCMQKDVEPLYDQAALDAAVAAENERRSKPLRQLGARLAELLDENQWAECEALLLKAGVQPN